MFGSEVRIVEGLDELGSAVGPVPNGWNREEVRIMDEHAVLRIEPICKLSDEYPLTVREAAKFLGVSPQTGYLWVERNHNRQANEVAPVDAKDLLAIPLCTVAVQ
jgi:hypothetical protein